MELVSMEKLPQQQINRSDCGIYILQGWSIFHGPLKVWDQLHVEAREYSNDISLWQRF